MKTLAFFSFALLISTQVFAKSSFLTEFKKTYPDSKKIATCKLCHTALPKPGDTNPNLNPYGLDFQRMKFEFKTIEDLDSDGDTYKNLEEISQDFAPGDKDLHPDKHQ